MALPFPGHTDLPSRLQTPSVFRRPLMPFLPNHLESGFIFLKSAFTVRPLKTDSAADRTPVGSDPLHSPRLEVDV